MHEQLLQKGRETSLKILEQQEQQRRTMEQKRKLVGRRSSRMVRTEGGAQSQCARTERESERSKE